MPAFLSALDQASSATNTPASDAASLSSQHQWPNTMVTCVPPPDELANDNGALDEISVHADHAFRSSLRRSEPSASSSSSLLGFLSASNSVASLSGHTPAGGPSAAHHHPHSSSSSSSLLMPSNARREDRIVRLSASQTDIRRMTEAALALLSPPKFVYKSSFQVQCFLLLKMQRSTRSQS
jgi:hypothetical protein